MATADSTRPASHHAVYAELWELFFAQQSCVAAMRALEGPSLEARDLVGGLTIAVERMAAEGVRVAETARDRCPFEEELPPSGHSIQLFSSRMRD